MPFRFTLDLEKSILYPATGEKQKFCYEIEGVGEERVESVGEDTSKFANLSHFLLGICRQIKKEDIAEIIVSINGESQTVVWGENVEIKTEENPDNPTGCVGLKFDFPLNKDREVMQVCITLNNIYAIGPVNVCLFGGNTTATGLMICGPVCGGETSCETTFYQTETVCVPVTVTPFANPGTAKATCCGKPVIATDNQCQGTQRSCTFTVTQRLCIEVPIAFGADIETGAAVVRCGDVSETPCDCSTADTEESVQVQTTDSETRRSRLYFNR